MNKERHTPFVVMPQLAKFAIIISRLRAHAESDLKSCFLSLVCQLVSAIRNFHSIPCSRSCSVEITAPNLLR